MNKFMAGVGIAGMMMLTGCHSGDDAPTRSEPQLPASTSVPHTQSHPNEAHSDGSALPTDQSDDLSNMNETDATAKPATLSDSQAGTHEDNH